MARSGQTPGRGKFPGDSSPGVRASVGLPAARISTPARKRRASAGPGYQRDRSSPPDPRRAEHRRPHAAAGRSLHPATRPVPLISWGRVPVRRLPCRRGGFWPPHEACGGYLVTPMKFRLHPLEPRALLAAGSLDLDFGPVGVVSTEVDGDIAVQDVRDLQDGTTVVLAIASRRIGDHTLGSVV